MVLIQEQTHKTHGNHWKAVFTEEELLEKRCPITNEHFEQFERVFMCNKCKSTFKKNEDVYKQKYPCGCDTKYDVEFFNCEVIKQ